jgi:undecaprenyl diphosphate synthase
MDLLQAYLSSELDRCLANGVRLEVIGRRDRLPAGVVTVIEHAEAASRGGRKLHLRIAIDYSGRESIVRAARELRDLTSETLATRLGPPVDLLIRTGGEQRLSDFLLWECAYAELVFSRRMWPDFDAQDLEAALRYYHGRERRFGAVPAIPAANGRTAWLD